MRDQCKTCYSGYKLPGKDGYYRCPTCGVEYAAENNRPPNTYPNGAPIFAPDGTMLDDQGNRSIFDDVDK